MEIALIIFAFLMVLIGSVGVFVPVLPGPLLAFLGPLIYYIFTPELSLPYVNTTTLCIFGALVAISFIFDYLSSYWGAVKFGATWKGGVGALAGAIIFPILLSSLLFGALIGMVVGPIIGAFVGEYIGGNTCGGSARAGLGTLVGAIAATLVKLFVCMMIFAWMLLALCMQILKNVEC